MSTPTTPTGCCPGYYFPTGSACEGDRLQRNGERGSVIEAVDGRRVVVTGVGVLCPAGTGAEAFWAGLATPAAARTFRAVDDFDPAPWGMSPAEARTMDRFTQLMVAAATQAVRDAGLHHASPYPDERCGVLFGNGNGGVSTWERQCAVLRQGGPGGVSPGTVPMVLPNAGAAAVSARLGWRGPSEVIATACASGTHAVINGAKLVAAARADAVVVGGSESCLTGSTLAVGFENMKALSPSGHSRPFDTNRDGFCCAEAAAALVLEDYTAAAARGANIYAEVAGAGSTADAHHLTAPAPGGRGAMAAMRLAMADAGVHPGQVSHVNAHGTSTALNDAAEAHAIRTVFGDHRPAVTSIKGVTGHSLGAAGAVEAVALALSYHHRQLPPTMGTQTVDPVCDIDVVLEPRPWRPAPALSNSFAFGGHNASVAFRPV